jgi:hypothetical protein
MNATSPLGAHAVPWGLAVALLAVGAACGEAAAPATAPTAPRATLVLEPPEVGIGGVAAVELAIVTPPDHHARPFQPPPEIHGFWLLDAETLPVEKHPGRWVHRTRIRIRAREVGRFVWPAGSVAIESPDGKVAALPLAALPLAVTSVLPELPDRDTPFGARSLPAPSAGPGRWGAAGAGAAAALAAVALVALVRRTIQRRTRLTALPPQPPWIRAREELREASAATCADPLAAAHLVAVALRRYMARRFGADAPARTTEELRAAAPPFAATTCWPAFLAILHGLDAIRFRPEAEAGERAAVSERVGALLAQAKAFVEDSIPPEDRS